MELASAVRDYNDKQFNHESYNAPTPDISIINKKTNELNAASQITEDRCQWNASFI